MAHEITDNDSIILARGRSAWHGLGEVSDVGGWTAVEAQKKALDWDVSLQPVVCSHPDFADVEVKARANIRMDTMETMGVVGMQFGNVQNHEIALAIDAATGGLPLVDVCGSLRGGRLVWFLLNLEGEQAGSRGDWGSAYNVVGDDRVDHYVAIMAGHDGSTALNLMSTSYRVVCKNTWNAAMSSSALALKVRHTATAVERTGVATQAILKMRESVNEQRKVMAAMAGTHMSADQRLDFVLKHLGLDPESESGKMKNKIEVARGIIQMEEQFAIDVGGQKDSVWTAFNAVTNYASHAKGAAQGGDDGRLVSQTQGNLARRTSSAWRAAQQITTQSGALATA